MSTLPDFYVGIDFHQKFSTVCVMDRKGKILFQQNCDSSADYIHPFVAWRLGMQEICLHAAIEACGGAAKLAEDLRKLGWQIELAHATTLSDSPVVG